MKRILLAVLAVAVFPLASQAGDLSYTYVEGGYTYLHNDNAGHLGDNWGGSGSAALGPNFFVFGGGSHTSEPAMAGISAEVFTPGSAPPPISLLTSPMPMRPSTV
jgi:hypothetical protein